MNKKKKAKVSKAEILKRRKIFLRRLVMFVILIVLAGLFFGIYHLYRNTVTRILVYQTFYEEDLKVTEVGKTIVLSDDDVMITPIGGSWVPLVEPLNFVEVNEPLAEIYDLSAIKEYQHHLEELNEDKKRALEEYNSRLSFYDESLKETEKEIGEIEKQLIKLDIKEDAETIKRLQARIDTLVEHSEDLLSKKDKVKHNTEQWDEQEKLFEKNLKENATIVYSNYSGAISFYIDGYENILTTSKMDEIEVKDFKALEYKLNQGIQAELSAGKPFAKVIKTPILCLSLFDLEDVSILSPGDSVSLILPSGRIIESEIWQMKQEGEQVILTFAFYQLQPELIEQRFPKLELIVLEDVGMKVPSDAITRKKGMDGVFIVLENKAFFHPISILQNRSGEALIKGLDSEAKIILNPRFALEGISIEGE